MERERRSFTVEFKLGVIKYAEENSGEAAARHFEIDSKTVRTWKKRKSELEILAATKEGERKRITKGPRKGKKEKANSGNEIECPTPRLSMSELCSGELCANCVSPLTTDRITNIKISEPFSDEDKYVVIMEAVAEVFEISWKDFLRQVKSKNRKRGRPPKEELSLDVALCKNCALFLEEIYSAYCSFLKLSHSNSLIKQAKDCRPEGQPVDNDSLDTDDLFDDFHFEEEEEEEEPEMKYDLKVPPECIMQHHDENVKPENHNHLSDEEESNEEVKPIRRRGRRKTVGRGVVRPRKEYKCDVCQEVFGLKAKLVLHARVHREPKRPSKAKAGPFPCQICGKVFKNREYVRKHERKRHSRQNVACAVCGKVMKNESTLNYHMKTIHISSEEKEKMKTTCEVCGKSMLLLALKQHMLLHTQVRNKFQCDKCEKKFSSEVRLQYHQQAHLSTTVHTCGECGRSFPIEQYLKEHQENHHMTEKPFGCEHCPMRFKSKSKAEDHKRIHAPEKAFICEECGKSCATQKHLNQHVKCHRDEEKGPEAFKCPDCNKCFKNRYCLYAHKIRSHRTDLIAGKRIFSCHICGKSLYDDRNLKKHIEAVHNKEKAHPSQRPPPEEYQQNVAAFPGLSQPLMPMHSTFLL